MDDRTQIVLSLKLGCIEIGKLFGMLRVLAQNERCRNPDYADMVEATLANLEAAFEKANVEHAQRVSRRMQRQFERSLKRKS